MTPERRGRTGPIRGLLVAVALSLPFWVGTCYALRAECSWCVATYCVDSSSCPSDCVCAIEMGDVTGHCAGTR